MFVSLRMKRGKVGKLPTWSFKGDEMRQWRLGHTKNTHTDLTHEEDDPNSNQNQAFQNTLRSNT